MVKQDTNRRDDKAEPLKLHSHRDLDDAGGVPAHDAVDGRRV